MIKFEHRTELHTLFGCRFVSFNEKKKKKNWGTWNKRDVIRTCNSKNEKDQVKNTEVINLTGQARG